MDFQEKILEKIDNNEFQKDVIRSMFPEENQPMVTVIWGDRGCGKSYASLLAFLHMDCVSPVKATYIRKEKIALRTPYMELLDIVGEESIVTSKEVNVVELKSGSKISFQQARNLNEFKNRLKGQKFNLIIVDEADQFNIDIFKSVLGVARTGAGEKCRIMLLSNPNSSGDEGSLYLNHLLRPYLTVDGESIPEENTRLKYFTFKKNSENPIDHVDSPEEGTSMVSVKGSVDQNIILESEGEYVRLTKSLRNAGDSIEGNWGNLSEKYGDLNWENIEEDSTSILDGKYVLGIGCDFASGSFKKTAGESAIVVVAYKQKFKLSSDSYSNPDHNKYSPLGTSFVIDGVRCQMNIKSAVEYIESFQKKYGSEILVIEGAQMGWSLLEMFNEKNSFHTLINASHALKIEARIEELSKELNERMFFISKDMDANEKLKIRKEFKHFSIETIRNRKIFLKNKNDYTMAIGHLTHFVSNNYTNLFNDGLVFRGISTGSFRKIERKPPEPIVCIPCGNRRRIFF